jgi:hypothetical protein
MPMPDESRLNIGSLAYVLALALLLFRSIFAFPVDLYNFVYAIIAIFLILRWLEPNLTISAFLRLVVPVNRVSEEAGLMKEGSDRQRALKNLAAEKEEANPFNV